MNETRRIDDRKVLIDGILFVRRTGVHLQRPCADCREPAIPEEERYYPTPFWTVRARHAYGRNPRFCGRCVAGRLAQAGKEALHHG